MKIVKINGFPNHVFKEGRGYPIDFALISNNIVRDNVNILDFNRSIYKHANNRHYIKIKYNFFSPVKKTIIDQKHIQAYREKSNYKIEPFHEKNVDYKEVKTNTEIFDQTLGYLDGNEIFLELDEKEYQDNNNLNLEEFVFLNEDDVLNYVYPIKFNKTSFHRRGGRINVFDIMNKLTLSSLGIDKFRGFKGYMLNSGKNATNENNVIRDFYVKNNIDHVAFEDGVLEGYLFNENLTKKIDKVNINYDPITKLSTTTFTFKDVIKISGEPRYTELNQQKITPYKDFDNNKNNPNLTNDSQIYLNKLKDDNLNNILLNNSTIFNRINEDKIFTNNGKTVDLSLSSGKESIIFHESLD